MSTRPNHVTTRRSGRSVATLVTATVAGVLLLTGTAGADVTEKRAPSRSSYIARADSICGDVSDQIDSVIAGLGDAPSDEDALAAVGQLIDLSRAELRQLRALTPPKGDAKKVAKIYRAVEKAFDKIEADPSKLFAEPSPLAKAQKLASSYGFEVCGQG